MEKIYQAIKAANINYPCFIIDLEDESQEDKDFMLKAGGFAAIKVPKDRIREVSEILELSEEASVLFRQNPFGVVVAKQIAARMKFDDIIAVIRHEEGHLYYGHIQQDESNKTSLNIKNNINIQHELQADRYAGRQVGYKAMKKAIDSVYRAIIAYEEKTLWGKVKRYWKVIHDPEYQIRRKALS